MVLGESGCPGREWLSWERVVVLVERVLSWEWKRGVGLWREGVSWERVFVLGESSCPGRESVVLGESRCPGRESVVLVERVLSW